MARLNIQDPVAASSQLEDLCQKRKRKELRQGIRLLLKHHPGSRRLLNRSIDWLARSGQFKEGLQLALPQQNATEKRIHNPIELGTERALLWMSLACRLSAWPWVARWLPIVAPKVGKNPRDRFLLAQCWLQVGELEKARILVQESLSHGNQETGRYKEDQERRAAPFHTLQGIYWRLGDAQRGLKIVRKTQELLKEDDRIGHWHVGLEMHHFEGMLEAPQSALKKFQTWDAQFSDVHSIAPRLFAVTRTLLAELQAAAGDHAGAKATFDQADQYYRESLPDYLPLNRLQLRWIKARCGLATPKDLALLAHYPGNLPLYRTQDSELFRKHPEKWFHLNPKPKKLQVDIDLGAKEYFLKERLLAGIPLEIQLLAHLWLASDLGIHRNLLLTLLWPDHWMIQLALDDRLSKLIARLRDEHGFTIEVKDECVFLSSSDQKNVFVDPFIQRPRRLQSLTEKNRELGNTSTTWNWETLLEGYELGPTQSRVLLNDWIERGWIKRVGQGRSTRYQIVP